LHCSIVIIGIMYSNCGGVERERGLKSQAEQGKVNWEKPSGTRKKLIWLENRRKRYDKRSM